MSEALRVVQPGLVTTIQDLGRQNAVASGVPRGGAMDRFAHTAANLIVGNERGAATLECTIRGPHLVAERQCLIAITGADLEPRIDGLPAAMWTALSLRAGARLTFGTRRLGARGYVAVSGGIIGDRWLGSMSTNLMCARGGMHGRALVAGDLLSTAEPAGHAVEGRTLAEELRPRYADRTLPAIAGPHMPRLQPESRHALFSEAFSVRHDSNRMGYRLAGPRIDAPGEELLSFGLVAGAVQLPSGGQPILLMADHQTAGGYPVVCVLASVAMPIAAQLAPGDELRFAETSIEEALKMRTAQRDALASLTS